MHAELFAALHMHTAHSWGPTHTPLFVLYFAVVVLLDIHSTRGVGHLQPVMAAGHQAVMGQLA